MKQTHRSLSALTALMLTLSLASSLLPRIATAGGPSVDAVLGIDQPDCFHVIDLLIRNRARRFAGHATPVGIDMLGAPLPGDLELLEVSLVADGAVGQGPIFQVSVRNTNRCVIRDFQISLVGLLERITPFSPCRSIRIPCINAGETKCIEIQLPARCMTMGPRSGPLAPFDTLVVAVDSLDEIIECNELNNVAILKRGAIKLFVATVPVAAATPGEIAPGDVTPNAALPNGTAPSTTDPNAEALPAPTPGDNAEPSPVDKIDLDKLDLDDTQETAMRVVQRL